MKNWNRKTKRRALLTGVGSLMDLQGETTYRRVQSMMPPPKRAVTVDQLARMVAREINNQ